MSATHDKPKGVQRTITLRRMIQQAGHCIDEARSVIERNEDARCAIDDLEQAKLLVERCLSDARHYARVKGDL